MKDGDLPDIGQVTTEVVDGLRIRITRGGRPNGSAILFTSPWPESIYAFHRVFPYFVETHRVIAIDLPGYGHSEGRPDVMSPRKMGAFLVKVIARLNLERVHAVGPDVGALACLFAAADHPGIFVSLAVGGGAVRVDLAAGELKNVIATAKGTFAAMNGADVMADYLTQAGKLTPAAIIEDFRMASAGKRFEEASEYVRAYKDDLPILGARMREIQTPVLVIAGRNDPIVPPANAELLAERLPHNRLALLDAAHRIWEEATESYAREILSWVGGGYRLV